MFGLNIPLPQQPPQPCLKRWGVGQRGVRLPRVDPPGERLGSNFFGRMSGMSGMMSAWYVIFFDGTMVARAVGSIMKHHEAS